MFHKTRKLNAVFTKKLDYTGPIVLKNMKDLQQNVLLRTLEIHFTFDIWSKIPSITMKN